jgi:nicotinamidase-related amidase
MANQAVIVIDAQREYGPGGGLEVPGIAASTHRISGLLADARASDTFVVHIRHVSGNPNDSTFNAASSGVQFLDDLVPQDGETVITKHHPNAFTNTSLDRLLVSHAIKRVYICGYVSFLCCDATAKHASELGYDVRFVEDAIGEFPLQGFSQEQLHATVCAIQALMYSTVLTAAEATGELAGT